MTIMRHKIQHGFSLITAIFLLVVLSLLGAMMVTFFTAQQQSSTLDVLGSRAYQAARAGIEWSAFQITQSQVVSPSMVFATDCLVGTSSVPVTPSTQPTLAGTPLSSFSLVVSCGATSSVAGTNVYNIIATASGVNGAMPGSADYVERVMQATIASGVNDVASGIIYLRESY